MISLIDDVDTLEAQLLKPYLYGEGKPELKLMDWSTAGAEVYVPGWRKQIVPYQAQLSRVAVRDMANLLRGPDALSNHILNPRGRLLNRTQREAMAQNVLTLALALSLLDNGWSLTIEPGSFHLQRNEKTLDPPEMISRLNGGALPEQEWQRLCVEAGIGDYRLAAEAGGSARMNS